MKHCCSFPPLGLVLAAAVFLAEYAAGAELAERLQSLIDAHQGQVAVAVKHLDTGESFGHRDDQPMPTASLIKVAVMVEAYRQAAEGKVDLDAHVTLAEDDKVPGSGILTPHFSPGASFPLRDAVRLMIAFSDNTATNLVLDQIGLGSTAATMESLGLANTKIHAKVFRGDTSVFPDRSRQFGLGSTTAGEMVRLLEMIHQRKLVSAAACEEMLGHLLACDDRARLPRHLPAGTKVAHKTGSVNAARTAAGILYTPSGPIAVCILTSENRDQRWTDDNAGGLLCAAVAREVFAHFNAAAESKQAPATSDRPAP